MTIATGPKFGQIISGVPGEAHFAQLLKFFRSYEALVMPVVKSRVAAVPTSGMVNGDCYLLTAAPNAGSIARYYSDTNTTPTSGWEYFPPFDGMAVWSTADQGAYRYKLVGGSLAWAAEGSGGSGDATQCIIIACSDESTALTAGSSKVTFRMPYAFTLQGVRASLTVAQTSGSILTVDINEAGTSVLSTKLTIDNTEKTSTTAATLPVISDTTLADDAEITIDIDQIGDGTAKGLKVILIGVKS